MKRYSLYILLFCVVFAISCKKDELPNSQIGTPEFVSQFSFNGELYSLSAGENGLVQTSSYDTSGTAITLRGGIGGADCNGCGPAYTLTVQSPLDFVYADGLNMVSELNTWDFVLNRDTVVSYGLQMHGSIGGMYGGDWLFNGTPISPQGDSLVLEITEPGNYTVEYAINQDSCHVSTTRNFDFDGESVPCYGNIIPDFGSPTTFYADPAFPSVPEEMTYYWFYGDTVIGTGNMNSFDFPPSALAGEVCVEMVTALGCSTTACYTSDSIIVGPQCMVDLLLYGAEVVAFLPDGLTANMILEFTDNSGNTYTSAAGSQNAAVVSVISINDYIEPSMPEKKFAKMEVSISCTLYDGSGNGYPFSGMIQTAFEYR